MTRQAVPTLDRTKYAPASGLAKGGYALNNEPKPDVLLIGTGSEVSLCVEATEKLAAEGIKARVVSLPCWELFEKQPQEYRDSVIPPAVTARVCVEDGRGLRVGEVRRTNRRDHRDAVVRRIGPAEGRVTSTSVSRPTTWSPPRRSRSGSNSGVPRGPARTREWCSASGVVHAQIVVEAAQIELVAQRPRRG